MIDTERGRDDLVETYSGGERTVLGEAVSLALSTLACRRYGFDRPTLVRDETSAALDAEKAAAYVAMIRRAAELIGADRVLIVSHSERVRGPVVLLPAYGPRLAEVSQRKATEKKNGQDAGRFRWATTVIRATLAGQDGWWSSERAWGRGNRLARPAIARVCRPVSARLWGQDWNSAFGGTHNRRYWGCRGSDRRHTG